MVNKILIAIIKIVLWIIDPDHRSHEQIAMDDMKKFTHVVTQDFHSDFGRAKRAFRTVPYSVWELKTDNHSLRAADRHRVIRHDGSAAWLEDLRPGDILKTDRGLETVQSCRPLGFRTHMFCLEVETADPRDPNNHLFYTDGILSHNTTCAAAFLLWKAMFTDDFTILITANNLGQTYEIMDRIKYAYENLPDFIRAGAVTYNRGSVSFDNGSKIVCRAANGKAPRGLSVSLLYVDEMAFIMPNVAAEFWTAVLPVLSTGGDCIVTSTPKSDEDQFAMIWKGAIDVLDENGNLRSNSGVGSNSFFAIEVPWNEHPERDDRWAKEQISQLGMSKFLQEHACKFVTDDDTLIHPMLLATLKGVEPLFYTETARWYMEPEPNKAYCVALDPAKGVGRDSSAIQVFMLPDMIQIAEWQEKDTSPRNQVRMLLQILTFLEEELSEHPDQQGEPEIYWTYENNGLGEAITTVVEDTGEERFPGTLISERKRKGEVKRASKGFFTTQNRKNAAATRFKSLLETGRIDILSKNAISELKSYVRTGASFAAKPGKHDDLISATLLSIRMLDIVVDWMDNDELRDHLSEAIRDDELDDVNNGPMPMAF